MSKSKGVKDSIVEILEVFEHVLLLESKDMLDQSDYSFCIGILLFISMSY